MADRLYIGDEEVDLSVSTAIAQTFQINDLAELKDRQGNFTNQFKLPKTDRNCRIFGYSNVMGSTTTVPYRALNAKIVSDGVETISGAIAYVQSVGDSFEVNVLGGNSKLFADIDGLKLSDLDLSAFDHLWDSTLVARYGFGVSPTLLIVDDTFISELNRNVELKRQHPAIYIKDVFEAIHTDAGYEVEGEILEDDFFKGGFIPFTNDTIRTSASDRTASAARAVASTDDILVDGQRIPFDVDQSDLLVSNYNPLSFEYTCPFTGKYKLDGRVILRLGSSLPPVFLQVFKNGVFSTNIYSGYSSGSYTILEFSQVEITCNSGDVITIHANWTSGATADFYVNGTAFSQPDLESYLSVSLSEELIYGGNWNFAANMPDITQKDFLKAIMHLFALTPQVNPVTMTVRYVRFEEIAKAKGVAKDWSAYLAQDVKDVPINFHPSGYGQKNYFRYKKDDLVTKELGDGFLAVDDTSLPATKEMVSLPFAASDTVTKLMGLRLAQIEHPEDVEPRILWRDVFEITDGLGDIELQEDGVTIATESDFACGQFLTSDVIRFAPFRSEQWPGFDRNVLETYYAAISDILTRYKRITPLMYLPAYEIATLDHFTPVYLSQFSEYFYINKIENYQSGKPCRVELIRL